MSAAGGHVPVETVINLSRGPILCSFHTTRSLPAEAWPVIQNLAEVIAEAATTLTKLLKEEGL